MPKMSHYEGQLHFIFVIFYFLIKKSSKKGLKISKDSIQKSVSILDPFLGR